MHDMQLRPPAETECGILQLYSATRRPFVWFVSYCAEKRVKWEKDVLHNSLTVIYTQQHREKHLIQEEIKVRT